jgi:ABC-2 type transport system ATP-binding protein
MNDVIQLEHVSKKLGGREVLRDINFSVKQGDIFGYLGPNGAGKTTTIRILLGLMEPTSGIAMVMGQDTALERAREKLGFMLETDGLYENLNGYDNLLYYARIYGVVHPEESIERVLKLVELSDRARDKVKVYSKGMRQRLALGRAVVHNPEVLILDEPTAGIDPSGQIEIRQIMLDMTHKQGKTILLSSHNLDEVQRICNRIALIHKGEIKLFGELEEMQRKMGGGEVEVETSAPVDEEVLADLKGLPELKVLSNTNKTLVFSVDKGTTGVSDIIALLGQRGVKIEQIKRREASLEEIYTAILKEEGQDKV